MPRALHGVLYVGTIAKIWPESRPKYRLIFSGERLRHRRANSAYGARAGSILLSVKVSSVSGSDNANDKSVIFDLV